MRAIETFPDILLQVEPVDFRKGRLSLSIWVESYLNEKPFSESLFLFTNRTRDKVKMLYWDKTGFAMWEKGLEKEKFPWPKELALKKIVLTSQQLLWLLEGIDFWQIKPHPHLQYSRVS